MRSALLNYNWLYSGCYRAEIVIFRGCAVPFTAVSIMPRTIWNCVIRFKKWFDFWAPDLRRLRSQDDLYNFNFSAMAKKLECLIGLLRKKEETESIYQSAAWKIFFPMTWKLRYSFDHVEWLACPRQIKKIYGDWWNGSDKNNFFEHWNAKKLDRHLVVEAWISKMTQNHINGQNKRNTLISIAPIRIFLH